jgi:cobalt-zinc-cadmium efflux system membrane fusion protein
MIAAILLPGMLLTSCRTERKIEIHADTTCCYAFPASYKFNSSIIDTMDQQIFSDTLMLTGDIKPDPGFHIYVSAPAKGFLKKIYCYSGISVVKGALLAELEHPYFSQLQFDYLETKSKYEYFKTDYARQGELGLEHATSLKNLQKAQSEFLTTESTLFSIRDQLEYLGLDPGKISPENITPVIKLYAPISGIVTLGQQSVGQFCPEGVSILSITDYSRLIVRITIPKNINWQQNKPDVLDFYAIQGNEKFECPIKEISLVDQGDSLVLYCPVRNNNMKLYPGMMIRTDFPTTNSAYAVLTSSIQSFEEGSFIYIEERNNCFYLDKVLPGRQQGDFTELLYYSPGNIKRILISDNDKLMPCN